MAEKSVCIWHRELTCCTCGEPVGDSHHVVSSYCHRRESTLEMEVAAIESLITHPAGYDVDLFGGVLVIRSTGEPMHDKETFEVEWETSEGDASQHTHVKSFPRSASREAAAFFVEKRRKLRLGLDFETSREAHE